MHKIIIVGNSGSGKSTLSIELSTCLNIPVFHLDQIFFKKEWHTISEEEFRLKQEVIMVNEPQWIVEGTYSRSLDIRLGYADTIIFLDLPRYIYFPRIVKRYVQNFRKVRVDMAEGCIEKLDLEFIQFVWTFKKRRRKDLISQLQKRASTQNLIQLQSKKEVKQFLKNLQVK